MLDMAQVIRSSVLIWLRANSRTCCRPLTVRYYSEDKVSSGKATNLVSNGISSAGKDDTADQKHAPASALDKAFDMFRRVESAAEVKEGSNSQPVTFTRLLRQSKLMQIGDPEGRVVVGTIVETLNDDMYIDFGGKFDCVCKKPRTRADDYRRGAKVRIRLHDLEMSSRFLGSERDITLLEADATLIGLHREHHDVKSSASIKQKTEIAPS